MIKTAATAKVRVSTKKISLTPNHTANIPANPEPKMARI